METANITGTVSLTLTGRRRKEVGEEEANVTHIHAAKFKIWM